MNYNIRKVCSCIDILYYNIPNLCVHCTGTSDLIKFINLEYYKIIGFNTTALQQRAYLFSVRWSRVLFFSFCTKLKIMFSLLQTTRCS